MTRKTSLCVVSATMPQLRLASSASTLALHAVSPFLCRWAPVSFRLHLSPSDRRPISSQRPLVTKKRKQVETPLANRLRGLLPWRVAAWTCRALATRSAVRTSCATDQGKATCWWPNPGLSQRSVFACPCPGLVLPSGMVQVARRQPRPCSRVMAQRPR